MFMIPMPPTRSEIEAMPAKQQRQHVAHRADRAQELGLGRDREVGRLTRGDVVALIEQCRDLGRDGVDVAWLGGLTPTVETLAEPTNSSASSRAAR